MFYNVIFDYYKCFFTVCLFFLKSYNLNTGTLIKHQFLIVNNIYLKQNVVEKSFKIMIGGYAQKKIKTNLYVKRIKLVYGKTFFIRN